MKIFIAMLIILLLCFGQTLAQYDFKFRVDNGQSRWC
jgi:hypothetical protein